MTEVICRMKCKHKKDGVCTLKVINLTPVKTAFEGDCLSCREEESDGE